MMAGAGILGEYKGSQAREVLLTLEEYEQLREQQASTEAEPSLADVAEPEHIPETAYATEGQQGYMSTDTDEEDE
jgi:hypothetical protein